MDFYPILYNTFMIRIILKEYTLVYTIKSQMKAKVEPIYQL